MSPLYAIMHHWAAKPFEWGRADCALCIADWIEHVTGHDPAAHLRGTYHDAASCQRVTGWFTDPVGVAQRALDAVPGCIRVSEALAGDVAVLPFSGPSRPLHAGAVFLGDCWGLKGLDGAVTVNPRVARPLAIWRVAHAA